MPYQKKKSLTQNEFIQWITVSAKGQISIPVKIRKKLDIKVGDQLLIILRKEKDGINLIRREAMDKAFKKFSS